MTRLISNINDNRARYVAPVEISSSLVITGSATITDSFLKFKPSTVNINTAESASYIYVSGSTRDLYFSQNGFGYSNVTRLRWIEGNLYTGLLKGGIITSASSTTFNISSGSGIIVSLNASTRNDPFPTISYVNWPNLTNQPLTYLTSSIQTFVGINNSGSIIQQRDPWFNGQYNTSISLGTVLHQNTASINGTITYPNTAYGYKQRTYDFIKAFGPLKLSGFVIYPSSSLGLTIGSGTAFADGRNYQTDPNNPSYITDAGTTVSKIFRYHVSASTYIQDTNGGLGYTVIDPAQYNNNGVLTPISPSTPWSNQRVFWYPNSVTKGIVVYYGTAVYASDTEAIANLPYESFVETPNTQQNAVYLGAITIKYNGTFTTPADFKILPAGVFRNVGGSGGGGAISSVLSGLSDVNISGPTNGQILVYNGSTLKWENEPNTADFATSASLAATSSFVNTLRQNVILSGSITARQTGFNASGIFTGDTIGAIGLSTTASNGFSIFTTAGTLQVFDNTNAANRIYIDNSGNVGIGTTPNATLNVRGTVRVDTQTGTPTAPATPGGTPTDYYGTDGTKYLGEPSTWLKINLDGADYYIAAYE